MPSTQIIFSVGLGFNSGSPDRTHTGESKRIIRTPAIVTFIPEVSFLCLIRRPGYAYYEHPVK
jgi:hypothetical protein